MVKPWIGNGEPVALQQSAFSLQLQIYARLIFILPDTNQIITFRNVNSNTYYTQNLYGRKILDSVTYWFWCRFQYSNENTYLQCLSENHARQTT